MKPREAQHAPSARIDSSAGLSRFDAAIAALPQKAGDRLAAALHALQARARQAQLDLKLADDTGDLHAQRRLLAFLESLRARIDTVTAAAIRQARALPSRQLPAGPRSAPGVPLDSRAADDERDPRQPARRDAGDGAGGLAILAQAIHNARHVYASIVDTMPAHDAAIAPSFATLAESASDLGKALDTAAMAVAAWMQGAQEARAAFAGDRREPRVQPVEVPTTPDAVALVEDAALTGLEKRIEATLPAAGSGGRGAGDAAPIDKRPGKARDGSREATRGRGLVEDTGRPAARNTPGQGPLDPQSPAIDERSRARETARIADALASGALGRPLLAQGKLSDESLALRVRPALAEAGMSPGKIAELLPGVMQRLRAALAWAAPSPAPGRGNHDDEAGQPSGEGGGASAGIPRSEVISDRTYLERILVAGFRKPDPIAGQQLAEAQKTNAKLDRLIARLGKAGPADVSRFAAKKGPA